jgi:hypothetical protein
MDWLEQKVEVQYWMILSTLLIAVGLIILF